MLHYFSFTRWALFALEKLCQICLFAKAISCFGGRSVLHTPLGIMHERWISSLALIFSFQNQWHSSHYNFYTLILTQSSQSRTHHMERSHAFGRWRQQYVCTNESVQHLLNHLKSIKKASIARTKKRTTRATCKTSNYYCLSGALSTNVDEFTISKAQWCRNLLHCPLA